MILVAISGKRRSGKSLFGSILEKEHGFKTLSLAAPLKELCREQFGLSEAQTDGDLKEAVDERYGLTPRQMMIQFGGAYRAIEPNFWLRRLFEQIKETPQAQMGRYVITDMRFRNELHYLRAHNAYTVRLERSTEFTGAPINDPSETELDNVTNWDLYVPASHNVLPEDLVRAAGVVGAHYSVA